MNDGGGQASAEVGSRFVQFMSRHLVALTCHYESLRADGSLFHRGTTVISGFVLEVAGTAFWIPEQCREVGQHRGRGRLHLARSGHG